MQHKRSDPAGNILLKRLGERLRALRGDQSLREFAPTIGIQPQTLFRIERGEHNVTLDTIARICESLGCTAGYLLDEPKPRKPPKKRVPKKKTALRKKKPS